MKKSMTVRDVDTYMKRAFRKVTRLPTVIVSMREPSEEPGGLYRQVKLFARVLEKLAERRDLTERERRVLLLLWELNPLLKALGRRRKKARTR